MIFYKKKSLAIFIYLNNKKNIFNSISEFKKLIISANIEIHNFIKINVRLPNNRYYIGYGKVQEINNLVKEFNYDLLIFNIVLKNSQERNLIKLMNCSILDRTNLILSIFRFRVNTSFGKLQVELAYLNYLSTRLVKRWTHLERQRGGSKYITGPGEKQIEIDRRILKKKIKFINKNLSKISNQRFKSNKLRKKFDIPVISLVGYTNSGKSTLFNLLTYSELEMKNCFFSTLDVYIRRIKLFKFTQDILLLDSVGFIENLPKNIFDAFEATLNEISNSQLIFHVVDISNVFFQKQIDVVESTLNLINKNNIPVIQIMNKIDKIKNCKNRIELNYDNFPYKIWISAKYNIGLQSIYQIILDFFNIKKYIYKYIFPLKIFLLIRDFLYKFNFLKKEFSFDGINYHIYISVIKKDFFRIIKRYPFINKYQV